MRSHSKVPIHIVFVGKSGSGKTTLLRKFVDIGYKPVISYTTRKMRPGEEQDVDYHFVSDKDFHFLEENGNLACIREFEMIDGKVLYGVPLDEINSDDATVSIIDPRGYIELYDKVDNIFGVYIDVPDDIVKIRCIQRGDDPNEIDRRLKADAIDFDIFNDVYQDICKMRIGNVRNPEDDFNRILELVNRTISKKG